MVKSQWTLELLTKSYQQGYITGLARKKTISCQYEDEVLIAAWEAGWKDGREQFDKLADQRKQA